MVNPFKNIDEEDRVRKTSHVSNKDKPRSRPKRDFNKVMRDRDGKKSAKAKEDSTELADKTDKKKGAPSIFDPSYHRKEGKSEKNPENLFDVAKDKYGPRPEFAKDEPDLAGTVVQNAPQVAGASAATNRPEAQSVHQMKEIWAQLVQKAEILQQGGKTDTTLTLKHPPLFAGAKLTLTTFDSAKGEFKVTFSELTPKAQELISLHGQESLNKALENKGYTVHIMVATTETEKFIAQADKSSYAKEQGDQRGQQQEEEPQEHQE